MSAQKEGKKPKPNLVVSFHYITENDVILHNRLTSPLLCLGIGNEKVVRSLSLPSLSLPFLSPISDRCVADKI